MKTPCTKTRAEVDAETERFSSTFYTDFAIANAFGESAVRGTFRRAFAEWREDYRYLTDLVMALNRHLWERNARERSLVEAVAKMHPEITDGEMREIARTWNEHHRRCPVLQYAYEELWRKANNYAYDHLTGEELAYFYRITD